MKKIFSVLLVLGVLSIIGCSTNNAANSSQADSQTIIHSKPTTAPTAPISIQDTSVSDETVTKDHPVKKIELLQRSYTVVNSKRVYGGNFNVKSTLTDEDSINFFSALLNDIALSDSQVDNWPKYNPARANEYAIKILLRDGSISIINLHFTEQSNICYIAIANCKEDMEYNSFVMSDNADELFAKHSIEKEKGKQLIGLFKQQL